MSIENQIQDHLDFIYGPEIAAPVFETLQTRLADFRRQYPDLSQSAAELNRRVSQTDAILITYGDQIVEPNKPPLQSLAEVLDENLAGVLSTVHILPFYPYSSDDGFSVIDYAAVDPNLGSWQDVDRLGVNFRLMFDAVINHNSVRSDWFKGYLADDPAYDNYYIAVDPATDLSAVTRPRALPLLTPFKTAAGTKHIWTTFSADQADLNYENPRLLLEIVDVLLFYVAHGAEFIRLDAIAFMWKEIGTPCLHLPQTHRIIQLFRTVLDAVAPNVILITETNVPHAENISYFGNGQNEAQMVYQFPLAPLILHTFHTGNATILQQWAAGLDPLPETATFFNFIASHDGIGLRPVEGLLSPAEIQLLADKTVDHGGHVSYKNNPDGSQSAYELNITLFDALSNPNSNEADDQQIDRFIASQAIMLAVTGVPGIYVHSLFGSSNDYVGVEETGRARSINRQKWLRSEVDAVMANPNARSNKVFQRYVDLLKARSASAAFHPNGKQQIIADNPTVFALLRTSVNGQQQMLCLHNITDQPQQFDLDLSLFSLSGTLRNVVNGELTASGGQRLKLTLEPYGVYWLLAATAR